MQSFLHIMQITKSLPIGNGVLSKTKLWIQKWENFLSKRFHHITFLILHQKGWLPLKLGVERWNRSEVKSKWRWSMWQYWRKPKRISELNVNLWILRWHSWQTFRKFRCLLWSLFSFMYFFLPSFLLCLLPSFVRSFLPSFLLSFIHSFIHSFFGAIVLKKSGTFRKINSGNKAYSSGTIEVEQ